MALYQGLSHKPVTFQHLEEFLITAGAKDKVTLDLNREAGDAFGGTAGENCAYRGPATQGNTVSV